MKLIGQSSGGSYVVEMNRSDWEFMGRLAAACQASPGAQVAQAAVQTAASPAAQRPEVERAERKRIAAKKPTPQPTGKTKECKVCGKAFTPKTSAKTCSPECAKENDRRSKAKSKNRTDGGKLGFRDCVTCGSGYKVKHADQQYCSEACRPKVDKAARLAALKDAAARVGIKARDPLDDVDRIARDIEREERG